MSDRLGIQVAVDSSSFVVRRFSFWSVQGICIALLTYQSKRILQGLSKRPSLHSLITLLKRCVSRMQFRFCMLTSGPMKAVHALDSIKNMKECSQGSQRLKKRYFMKKFTNRGKKTLLRGKKMSPVSLFFVTTSTFGHWVICVPAAFLRCGSRF